MKPRLVYSPFLCSWVCTGSNINACALVRGPGISGALDAYASWAFANLIQSFAAQEHGNAHTTH